MRKLSYQNNKGAVILEFSLVLPIMIILCFLGYNIIRQIEVHLVKRNISHTLASAYSCSFQPRDIQGPDYSSICFQNIFNTLSLIEGNFKGKTSYAVSIYRPVDPANPPNITRNGNNCYDTTAILDSNISFFKGRKSDINKGNFKFTPRDIQGPLPPGASNIPLTLRALLGSHFQDNSVEMQSIARQYCLNNFTIMITEFNILEAPFLNIHQAQESAYYEFGII